MAALSANNPNIVTNPGPWTEFPVAAATHIYQGARVCVNGSGYAVPASDASGLRYVGIAGNEANNAAGSAGAMVCAVQGPGNSGYDPIHTIAIASTATQATVGVDVFLMDDQTVDIAANSTNKVAYGTVVKFISATTVQVDTGARFTRAVVA